MKNFLTSRKFLIFTLIESVPFVLSAIFYKSGAVDEIYWLIPTLVAVSILNLFIFKITSNFIIIQSIILLLGSLCRVLEAIMWISYAGDDGWAWAFRQLYTIICAVAIVPQIIVVYISKPAKPRSKNQIS